jgi:release factor glutamine methyltransferase
VLVPRTETELLVERALAHIPTDETFNIADLGTGSGAIALALARERPRCRVVAVDASADALAVAERNAQRLQLANIEFKHGHWFDPVAERRFDLIVSNPPYIRADDEHLEDGDLRFEPATALVGGVDGLDAIRDIVADARAHLAPGGWLLLEHGHDQADDVAAILYTTQFTDIGVYRDLAGHPRVTEARAAVLT